MPKITPLALAVLALGFLLFNQSAALQGPAAPDARQADPVL